MRLRVIKEDKIMVIWFQGDSENRPITRDRVAQGGRAARRLVGRPRARRALAVAERPKNTPRRNIIFPKQPFIY